MISLNVGSSQPPVFPFQTANENLIMLIVDYRNVCVVQGDPARSGTQWLKVNVSAGYCVSSPAVRLRTLPTPVIRKCKSVHFLFIPKVGCKS